MNSTFDIRLIQTFNSDKPDSNLMEWFNGMELVCRMLDMKTVECVLALLLKGRVFKVYQQLSGEDKDTECIKHALIKLFGTDSFVYGQFSCRWVVNARRVSGRATATGLVGWKIFPRGVDDLCVRCQITKAHTRAS